MIEDVARYFSLCRQIKQLELEKQKLRQKLLSSLGYGTWSFKDDQKRYLVTIQEVEYQTFDIKLFKKEFEPIYKRFLIKNKRTVVKVDIEM
jgi:predicted phage-related endonuclease